MPPCNTQQGASLLSRPQVRLARPHRNGQTLTIMLVSLRLASLDRADRGRQVPSPEAIEGAELATAGGSEQVTQTRRSVPRGTFWPGKGHDQARPEAASERNMNIPPRVSHETVAVGRILEELGPLTGVDVFRGQASANRIDVAGWGLSVLQQFQFGDLRLETKECRVIVEVESAGGVTNLAKYWPLLRGPRDKRFVLIHVFQVLSAGDYLAHRRLWQFIVDEMRRDQTLGQDWNAELVLYGPGASDDPFPRLAARIRAALGLAAGSG